MRYIVNEDGVIESELKEGDKILRKKSQEYLADKIEVHYTEYITVNSAELRLLMDDIDKNEASAIMALLPYVSFTSSVIQHKNGKCIGTEDMPKILGMSRNTSYETINKLVAKDILYKGKNSKEVQYYMNPWLTKKGRKVNSTLASMFKNYYVRSLKCRVKDLDYV